MRALTRHLSTGHLSTGLSVSDRIPGQHYELPDHVRLLDVDVPDSVLDLVPETVARENAVAPLAVEDDTIICATPHDTDVMIQDKLRFILNCNVRFIYRSNEEVNNFINFHYGQVEGESADSMLQEFTDTAIDFDDRDNSGVCLSMAGTPSRTRNVAARRASPAPTACRNLKAYASPEPGDGFMFYTIDEGQQVLAYRPNGTIDLIEGPKRVWKGRSRFERMPHFIAHPSQYLTIRFRDGREETRLGPVQAWLDRRVHDDIQVHDCLDLAAKEAVVVYSTNSPDDESGASRRIVYGPGLFAPRPGEWLHKFSWHASHGGSRGVEKRPNALKFQQLCLMPDQMYHDVRDVRTADDAVLTIRLMIFFELVDIERMLDTTHDPIGDFINAATSDVVEFTGKRSFEQFKQQTEQLNELSTYNQLLHRASQCGYKINNVVYRGYGAPDSLQAMHDEAIQTRTRLQLEKATEKQAQEVEDYKLSCQMERSARRRQEQMTEVQHDLETKRQQSDAELARKERVAEFSRNERRAQAELELELKQRGDEQKQAHLEALRGMQVNLTEYLTQSRADQVIEVRGDAKMQPELHLANGKSRPK